MKGGYLEVVVLQEGFQQVEIFDVKHLEILYEESILGTMFLDNKQCVVRGSDKNRNPIIEFCLRGCTFLDRHHRFENFGSYIALAKGISIATLDLFFLLELVVEGHQVDDEVFIRRRGH